MADYGHLHNGLVERHAGQRVFRGGDRHCPGRCHVGGPITIINQWRHHSCRHCKHIVDFESNPFVCICYALSIVHCPLQTADEYLVEYDRLRGTEYSRFHGYTYDGIWAAALAIQYVAEKREDLLTHFDYRVKDWENIFLEALRNTSFEGVTVCII